MKLEYRTSQRIPQIKMLFASANISACLLVPPCGIDYSAYGTKTIEIPHESYAECIERLKIESGFRSQLVTNLIPSDFEQTLVYPIERIEISLIGLSAAEFIRSDVRINDLNITMFNDTCRDFSYAKNVPYLRVLDLSRLTLTDENIHDIFSVANFLNLRGLDLSGNRGVSERGVRVICNAIRKGQLKQLDWLDLTGTSFDVSPYIDGHYWRINEQAKKLADEFGYQRWMMLGSRIPELANVELLTSEQREIALGRLRLA